MTIAPMPAGVEHAECTERVMLNLMVTIAPMPAGVEHIPALLCEAWKILVTIAPMPAGVEHTNQAVVHVTVEVGVPGREARCVGGQESPGGRVVVRGMIVIRARFKVVHLGRVPQEHQIWGAHPIFPTAISFAVLVTFADAPILHGGKAPQKMARKRLNYSDAVSIRMHRVRN